MPMKLAQTTSIAFLAAAQAGDPHARERLARGLDPIVTATARGIAVAGSWIAEEAAQVALIDIFNGLPGLEDPERIVPWAKTITVRRTIKMDDAERRRGIVPLDFDLMARTTSGLLTSEKIEVLEAFRCLPARQRAVTHLRLTGHKESEVAEMLGCAVGTVKAAFHHGRARLEAELRWRELTPDRFE
jgi:DNA-directed RNA polymerase specialized sigma24 family protein